MGERGAQGPGLFGFRLARAVLVFELPPCFGASCVEMLL